MTDIIADIAAHVLDDGDITREQAAALTRATGDDLYDLFYWANKIRIKYVGRQVKFCSILAAKVGACSEDCGFCSQSGRFKTEVEPYKHSVDDMFAAADQAAANGASSFGIVNAGRGPTDKELDWLEPFFRDTAGKSKIRPCATLGELTEPQAKRLRDMGVMRVNHNLETSRRFFPNVVSTHSYDDRVRTIKIAKAAGLSICSGGIFGMGEVWEDRLDVAFELRDLGADVVPINFLVAIQGTPMYEQTEPLLPTEALKIIAIYRFILRDKEIKIAGGREKVLRDMQSWIFFAGASSFLIGNYLTTYGREPADDHQMLRDLGLPYLTFDEVEHETPPSAPAEAPTGAPGVPGSLMALPIAE